VIRVRRVPDWRSATAGVDGADSYTASGFASPTRRVLASVLHTRAEIRTLEPGPAEPAGPPRECLPGVHADRPDRSHRGRGRPGLAPGHHRRTGRSAPMGRVRQRWLVAVLLTLSYRIVIAIANTDNVTDSETQRNRTR
jgi:hypothetical protein